MAADKRVTPGELREIAASALPRAPQSEGERPGDAAGEVCAHLDLGSFALLLPGRALSEAEALASTLQRRASEHNFLFNNRRIPVDLRVRAMLVQGSDTDATQVVNQVEEQMKRGSV